MSKFNLSGKTVIVTGGGSGIGASIVFAMAKAEATVHLLDLSIEAAKEVSGQAEGKVIVHQCDVSNSVNVENVIKAISDDNPIDVVVNNAGIAHIGNVETTTVEDMQRLFNVNVMGVYNSIKAAVPFMKQNGGSIINMASIAATVGLNDRFAYSMTKGAVYSLSLSVAKDYLQYNIRCNTISPARVHTPFVDGFLAKNYPGKEEEMFEALSKTQPIGRMGKPQEIGDLVQYLASDEAAFITGSDFTIDGGFVKLNS
ncbi:MAG: SDR family oxidoreductase [Ekhidna sp.]|nr:SDR family oxidoreductase [Ekhidna sp.]